MPQTYPVHITRKIDGRWARWSRLSQVPLARDDNETCGHCPACGSLGPIAPVLSEYRGSGLIDQHWQCQPCGYEWMTAQTVPA